MAAVHGACHLARCAQVPPYPQCLPTDLSSPRARSILVSPANVEAAVLSGCRHRLLGVRRAALEALRRGFVQIEDLQLQASTACRGEAACLPPHATLAQALNARPACYTTPFSCHRLSLPPSPLTRLTPPGRPQLAAFNLDDLLRMLQGSSSLSAADLLDCFVLPSASRAEVAAAGFEAAGARTHVFFEQLLRDEAAFGAAPRLALLQWCTALGALPIGGLRAEDKIRLRLYGPEEDDATLPETHTCTRELHLPNYSGAAVLREKLFYALAHGGDGFHKT